MLFLAASSAFLRRPSSSTAHSKKSMALSTSMPASRNRLPRSASEPPPSAYRFSSSIQGSMPWNPALAAISISSTIGSFWPRIVLVFSPRRKPAEGSRPPAGPVP